MCGQASHHCGGWRLSLPGDSGSQHRRSFRVIPHKGREVGIYICHIHWPLKAFLGWVGHGHFSSTVVFQWGRKSRLHSGRDAGASLEWNLRGHGLAPLWLWGEGAGRGPWEPGNQGGGNRKTCPSKKMFVAQAGESVVMGEGDNVRMQRWLAW